jgi:hypothetical protein
MRYDVRNCGVPLSLHHFQVDIVLVPALWSHERRVHLVFLAVLVANQLGREVEGRVSTDIA